MNRRLTTILAIVCAVVILSLNVVLLYTTFGGQISFGGQTVGEKIFRHILVPLDGSRLAESALTNAVWLARKMDAQMTLVHIIEKKAPSGVHNDRHLVTPEEAPTYLQERFPAAPRSLGLRVETHVHTTEVSDVARSIAEHSAELTPDLIVMCTHGKGGHARLLFGNRTASHFIGTTPY